MDLLTWLFVGIGAGVLASARLFRELNVAPPFAGLAGVIFTAGIGSVVLLALLHLVAGRRSPTS